MLVVVKNRNIDLGLEPFFDLKALWRRDIFKIDCPKARCNCLDGSDDFVRGFCFGFCNLRE